MSCVPAGSTCALIFRAFSKGADGVFIGACHLSECNYITHGNYHALNMVHHRRRRSWSTSGSTRKGSGWPVHVRRRGTALCRESVNDFVKKMKELGPLGQVEGMDEKTLKFKLDTVTELIPYIRLVERETA